MSNPTIRRAIEADLPVIGKLLQAEGMPLFDYEEYLDTFWVLDTGSEVTGCIGLEIYGSSALLRSIVVAPSTRGTGDGHKLTSHWLGEARARDARTAYLFTMDKAPFFSRYGFERCEMEDFDADARRTTQYTAIQQAPAEFVKLITPMRLVL
jgi:N-acetylglutamate synthase-like GNAT family acetyltransferase